MILIDTVIWVRAAGSKHPEITRHLKDLTERDMVSGHPYVFGELLIGKAGDSRTALLTSYGDIKQVPTLSHEQVVTFVQKHALANKGIGWVDAHLLASTHTAGIKLWTADVKLLKQATALECAYEV